MSLETAHGVIPMQNSTSVAFGGKRTSTGRHDRLAQQKVTKSLRAVIKQREQAEIVKEGTTPAF
jgi:hypothetical protein